MTERDDRDGASSARVFVRAFLGMFFLVAAIWTWRTPGWPEEIKAIFGW